MSILGTRVLRTEDPALLTVGGKYVDDLIPPGSLQATFVRSVMAHAEITGIDTGEAEAMPGVVAVFTGRGVDATGEVALALAAALKGDEPLPPNREGNARLNTAIQEASEPPPVQPVAPLPPMAEEVSGKDYRLEPNQFDVKCIALRFDSPSEVCFDLSLGTPDEHLR